jgi:hypothetical protein
MLSQHDHKIIPLWGIHVTEFVDLDDTFDLGEAFRPKRKALGLTQSEVAKK